MFHFLRIHKDIDAIIDMALCILESPQGRQSLVALANQLVALRNAKKKPQKHLYTGSPEDMHMAINMFLQKIRSSFPFVFLTLFDGEGVTTKEEGEWGDSLQNYEPQRAVWLALHSHIIDNMLFARQQSKEVAGHSYALFKFQMVITVAHEICHMLTNFLTGADRPHTPPGLKVAGYGNRMTGESSRWWEVQMFGGLVEFYENQRDPLGVRQAGVPYLMTNGNPKSSARQLSINYVLDFVNGSALFIPPT